MKIVIIDDEVRAGSLLKYLIEEHYNSLESTFYADNLRAGVELIKKHNPHLVLLDIEMPDEKGLEIVNYFDDGEFDFELVFTTAYSEYAIQAFEINAFDYLLKPIRPEKLKDVLIKVENTKNKKQIHERLSELKSALQSKSFNKIGLSVSDGIIFVSLEEIVHFAASGMYTEVFLKSGKKVLVSKPLKNFEYLTEINNTFYRPHRSFICNLQYLKQYVRRDGNYIIMENKCEIPISKHKREEFLQIITSI